VEETPVDKIKIPGKENIIFFPLKKKGTKRGQPRKNPSPLFISRKARKGTGRKRRLKPA
jgi:hypothetical protein